MQWNCKFGIEYEVSDTFLCYFSVILGTHERPQEKIGDPQNTNKNKLGIQKLPTKAMMALDPRDPRWHGTH